MNTHLSQIRPFQGQSHKKTGYVCARLAMLMDCTNFPPSPFRSILVTSFTLIFCQDRVWADAVEVFDWDFGGDVCVDVKDIKWSCWRAIISFTLGRLNGSRSFVCGWIRVPIVWVAAGGSLEFV